MKIKELIFLVVFCALILIGSILMVATALISTTVNVYDPYVVIGKHEHNGKCYIQTWIEVTPEEYIGLDIGDPYPSN